MSIPRPQKGRTPRRLCAITYRMSSRQPHDQTATPLRSAAQRLAAACSALLLAGTSPADAIITEWQVIEGGAVRLVVAGKAPDSSYEAGLEIALDPEWHTYWRYPGETGIPPELSFEGSANLAHGSLSFPAPERYDDGFSQSIVYTDSVLLPLRLTPEAADRPLKLEANAFFGVCNKICVPAEARFTLDLAADPQPDRIAARLISTARAALPVAMQETEGPRLVGFSFREGKSALKLDITADVGDATSADLFAEGAAEATTGLPKPGARDGSKVRWSLSLKGLSGPEEALPLRLVLVTDGRAVEASYTIDSRTRSIRRTDGPAQ